MKFARDSAMNLATLVAVALLTFLLNVVIARLLGPEGKGLYSLLVQVNGLLTLGVSLGLGNSAIFLLGRKLFPESIVVGNLLTVSLVIGSVTAFATLFFLSISEQVEVFGIPNALLVLILAITPVSLAKAYSGHILAAFDDFLRYNGVGLIDIASRFILVALFLSLGAGTEGMTWAIMLGTIIATSAGWHWIRRIVPKFSLRPDKAFLSHAFSFGMRAYIVTWLFASALRIDLFIVSALLDVSSVGVYSVAVSFAELSRYVAIAVALVLFSRVSSATDSNSSVLLSGQVTRMIVALSIGMALALGLMAPLVIELLFGQDFMAAIPAIWWLLPGIPMFNLTQLMQNDLAGRGKPELGIVAVLMILVVMVGADLLLIPIWGIVGASIASSLGYAVGAIIMFVFYNRTTGQSLTNVAVFSKSDLVAVVQLGRQFVKSLNRL
jgi:stage V sporulation protein B